MEKINEPQFTLVFKTDVRHIHAQSRTFSNIPAIWLAHLPQNYAGATGSVQFVSGVAGLQDLLAKLKDAAKALERYSAQ